MANDKPGFEDSRRSIEILAEQLLRCVVPIFCIGKSAKPESHGTGFLVSNSAGSFLVSAAHVFDPLRSNVELFFNVGPTRNRKLVGAIRQTRAPDGEDRNADRLDIGVLKLEGEALPPYPQINKQALPTTAMMESKQPREGKQYLVTGFPGSKSRLHPIRKRLESTPWGSWMPSAALPAYAEVGCNPERHIVMPFDQKKVFGKDGIVHAFPNPAGMSGSPVWSLDDDIDENDPEHRLIVGVFIEYHRSKKLVVATDIGVALDMIMTAF